MTTERADDGDAKSGSAGAERRPAKLGGARAEFVASLGKKLKDARGVLAQLAGSAGGGKPDKARTVTKDDLRRRLHAVGASAKLLRFDQMAQALADAADILDRTPGGLTTNDVGAIASVLDELPAMAWGEPAVRADIQRVPAPAEPVAPAPAALRRIALVVGSALVAEAMTDEDIPSPYDCRRTEDAQTAMTLAREHAPDVVVVDEDVPDASELVEALLDDATTDAVPVIMVGAKMAARFTALGVARALPKPITAEDLRLACDEAIAHRNEVTMRVTLGEPTVEQLAERLAEEVRRAIGESAGVSRGVRVPLGEGTEVMSAVWGAIARVREVVSARTGGAVRFGADGPEGAIAVAPLLQTDVAASDRLLARGRGAAADVQLHGRRVVVADDDPGVTWFIADLLRTAGCTVHEALDGKTALDLCFQTSPEVVISDVLMPGLDGFALTRALKRDLALRDVPVILLSWKEDLLQRVRELGASAAAYMRKESDSRAILARVRECLRQRARIEARLRGDGEVRGRLDGLTPASLLELACALRPNSRVSVRDASFLYEVELRDGAPRRATRSRSDAREESFARGELALAALLGVGAGRFTVAPSTGAIAPQDRDFTGSLTHLLAKPLSIARAARRVTTGAATVAVEKVRLDRDALPALTHSTPEPARSLMLALADGASPRRLLLGGEVEPALLDDVLGDLAARGVIEAVWNTAGDELLAAAVSPQAAARPAPPRPTTSAPPPAATTRRTPAPPVAPRMPAPVAAREREREQEEEEEDEPIASSLTDAVMRELSDRTPDARTRSSNPPPIVEPSALRPRSSNPPFEAAPVQDLALLTPIPADAVVPAQNDDRTEVDAPVEPSDRVEAREEREERSVPIPIDVATGTPAPVQSASLDRAPSSEQEPARTPLAAVASSRGTKERDAGPPPVRWTWLVALGAAATLGAITLQVTSAAPNPAAAASVAPPPTATPDPTSSAPQNVTYVDIPVGYAVGQNQGMVEVHTRGGLGVRIDGIPRGDMPAIRVPADPGPHEILITARGQNDAAVVRQVEVRTGKSTRIDLPAL